MDQKSRSPLGRSGPGLENNRGQRLNEASLPHPTDPKQSPISPADAYQHWKALDQGPTEHERRVLRAAMRGGIWITHTRRGRSYTLADGRSLRSGPLALSPANLDKFITLRWVVPDAAAPALFPSALAQHYVVSTKYRL